MNIPGTDIFLDLKVNNGNIDTIQYNLISFLRVGEVALLLKPVEVLPKLKNIRS